MGTEALAFSDLVAAWPLFQDAVLCAIVAGAVLGYLGVFIVLRRMVFVAATLSQAAGLGVALTFYVGIHQGLDAPPFLGAWLASVAAAGLTSLRLDRLHIGRDTVLAFTWLVAAGGAILVGDRITQEAHDIAGILFGTAVLVRPEDLTQVGLIGGLALGWPCGPSAGWSLPASTPMGPGCRGCRCGVWSCCCCW